MSSENSYDYIFLGAGCSSLSTLMRILDDDNLKSRKILLIDKSPKVKNDRTWCFWEEKEGYFETIVYKKWDGLQFFSDDLNIDLKIEPYQYKMIRSIDFYNYCFARIRENQNIECVFGNIEFGGFNSIQLDGIKLNSHGAIIFNSIYQPPKVTTKTMISLKQHFKGITIQTPHNQFNPGRATLMDFRVDQSAGATFVYVLPFTENKALVEYTAFSENTLSADQYNENLNSYLLQTLGISEYSILEEETGVIPMTTEIFLPFKNGMYNIGTAGGQTKASTGYTFAFIQKRAESILQKLKQGKEPDKINTTPKRFSFYDNTLLHILSKSKLPGKKIFEILFTSNKASRVFRFLDNESSVREELEIINSLPKRAFLKAGIIELIKMLK